MGQTLLTPKELAQRWKKSDKSIYDMKDEIGYIRLGGSIRFPLENVEAYERTHTVVPKDGDNQDGQAAL